MPRTLILVLALLCRLAPASFCTDYFLLSSNTTTFLREVALWSGARAQALQPLRTAAAAAVDLETTVELAGDAYIVRATAEEIGDIFAGSPYVGAAATSFGRLLRHELDVWTTYRNAEYIGRDELRNRVLASLEGSVVNSRTQDGERFGVVVAVLTSALPLPARRDVIARQAGGNAPLRAALLATVQSLGTQSITDRTSSTDASVLFARELWRNLPAELRRPTTLRELDTLRSIVGSLSRWQHQAGIFGVHDIVLAAAVEENAGSALVVSLRLERDGLRQLLDGDQLVEQAYSSRSSGFMTSFIGSATNRAELIDRLVAVGQIDLNPGNFHAFLPAWARRHEGTVVEVCYTFVFATHTEAWSVERDARYRRHLETNLPALPSGD